MRKVPPPPLVLKGRTAKELCVAILEGEERKRAPLVTDLIHANYIGRELQRAEEVLRQGEGPGVTVTQAAAGAYVQD